MNLEITARVKEIRPEEIISDKLTKQIVVIEYKDNDYTKILALEFLNKNIEKIRHLKVGSETLFKINLNCREHNGNFYTSTQCWFVEAKNNTNNNSNKQANELASDDLPF